MAHGLRDFAVAGGAVAEVVLESRSVKSVAEEHVKNVFFANEKRELV